jgi:hypothetical protein
MGDLQEAIDTLHGVPLESFVAERTRLARELRKAGDRAAAAELAKLPKPSAAAWALNHVAREDPDAVAAWLDAVQALREASSAPKRDVLRAAMADHRTATAQLLGIVRDSAQPGGRALSEAMLDRVRALLQDATVDPDLGDRLQAGRVTEEPDEPAAAAEAEAPEEEAPAPAPRRKRKPARDEQAEEEAAREREAAERRAELEARVADAEERLEQLAAAVEEREAAAAAAAERLEEARRTLHRTESEADAAHEAVDAAREEAATAERELEQLRKLLRRA